MKTFIKLLFLSFFATVAFAQAPPQGINYQAVAYDFNRTAAPGIDMNFLPAANRNISVRFTIIAQSPTGGTVYREYHQTTTDLGGLFNLIIGRGIPDNSPNAFSQINWGAGLHFLKVEIDNRGGFNYVEMSTQQLWSVPYALYAGTSGNGITNIIDNGDGTLTFNFNDSTSYTTNVLSGLTGPQGPAGPTGPQGATGLTGPQGPQGPAGANSISSSFVQNDSLFIVLNNGQTIGVGAVVGPQGPAGPQGQTGPQGPQGPAGANSISSSFVQNDSLFLVLSNGQTIGVGTVVGQQGPQGIPGQDGNNGLSAYEQWLLQGNSGSVADFLNSIIGPQGPQGIQGPQGPQGAQGPQGNGFQNGLSLGQILYWDGISWILLNAGAQAQILTICNGVPTWTTGGVCPGSGVISTLSCGTATQNGTLAAGSPASGVSMTLPYTGGNGGTHNGQTVISSGITGLTATLAPGSFANGAGTIIYYISGTASSPGTANFPVSIGGQSCNLSVTVGLPIGNITTLSCGTATNNGTLTAGSAASGVSSIIPYTGGNGGTHNGQTVTSTGISGLTVTLTSGTFANGAGTLTYIITGTPATSGTASFALNIGGQACVLARTVALPVGTITALSCGTATNSGTLTQGIAASSVSSLVPYTGGNGGTHNGQIVTSTGVTGLTATLSSGTFANGAGTLTYNITGTPATSGTASFALNIGGQTCVLTRTIAINLAAQYPAGSVFCASVPTAIVDVTNPVTGKTWMDRNLGASRAATSSTDAQAYGDLYQWGRRSDGHQCRNSATTSTLSSIDQPAHGNFILAPNSPNDWRSPPNTNLWQGVNGVNNPCPSAYRLPTEAEWNTELLSWSSNNAAGAFVSLLKLPNAGSRSGSGAGTIGNIGSRGVYWSSTVINTDSRCLLFYSIYAGMTSNFRVVGVSVRCIMN